MTSMTHPDPQRLLRAARAGDVWARGEVVRLAERGGERAVGWVDPWAPSPVTYPESGWGIGCGESNGDLDGGGVGVGWSRPHLFGDHRSHGYMDKHTGDGAGGAVDWGYHP